MMEELKINQFDVVQVQPVEDVPTEFVGCLGYAMRAIETSSGIATGWEVRFYLPKTVGENAEFATHLFANEALVRVGSVSENMRPL